MSEKFIPFPVGFRKHDKFQEMVEELGHYAVGIFFFFQDYALDNHENDDLTVPIAVEGEYSFAWYAKRLKCSLEDLEKTVDFCVRKGMIYYPVVQENELIFRGVPPGGGVGWSRNFVGLRFVKAPKPLSLISSNGNGRIGVVPDLGKGGGGGSHPGVPPTGGSSVLLLHTYREPSSSGSEISVPENSSREGSALNTSFTTTTASNLLEGFDCSMEKIVEGLGFEAEGSKNFHNVLVREASLAGVRFKIKHHHAKFFKKFIEDFGELNFHGAFRVFIHETCSKNVDDHSACFSTRRCFEQKLEVFKELVAPSVRQRRSRVDLSRSDELPVEPQYVSSSARVADEEEDARTMPKIPQDEVERRTGLRPAEKASFKPGWFDDPDKPAAQYAIEAKMASQKAEDESFALILQQIEENARMPIVGSKGKEIIN